jgi:hypothetical protein
MNTEDENIDRDGEEEPEKFSDDPEEQLRIENELLRLQLQAETGADIQQLEDVPPEVENAFLNNILAFERQLDTIEEVSIYKILGEPKDFKAESELTDDTIETELERLEIFMREHNIEVDYGTEYPARLKYKFITEELFLHETQQFDIPEMVNHFIYEEFHPNHRLTIEGITEDFLDMWLNRKMDESSYIFGNEFISRHNTIYPKEQFFNLIHHIFDAYLSFEEGSYSIANIAFDEMSDDKLKGLGHSEGTIRYRATLESQEIQEIEAPFKLYLMWVNGYWEIMNVMMPGLEL